MLCSEVFRTTDWKRCWLILALNFSKLQGDFLGQTRFLLHLASHRKVKQHQDITCLCILRGRTMNINIFTELVKMHFSRCLQFLWLKLNFLTTLNKIVLFWFIYLNILSSGLRGTWIPHRNCSSNAASPFFLGGLGSPDQLDLVWCFSCRNVYGVTQTRKLLQKRTGTCIIWT